MKGGFSTTKGGRRLRGRALATIAGASALAVLAARSSPARTRRPQSTMALPAIALQSITISPNPGSITAITNAHDARLFLTIQSGKILILKNGSLLGTPFLDISSLVLTGSERGMLSVAFHPQYPTTPYFFVYYTTHATGSLVDGDIVIARYQVSANPDVADSSSGVMLLGISHPTNSNHNGGQLQFGPNGYLYIGTGDGGSSNDPPCNAQNDDSPLGKMLRIDVDQSVNTAPYYGVPPSNPNAGGSYPRNLTWAKGLRNPWRFSFDRGSGDLWIGDVGQSAWEEIDVQPASSTGGENYGWKVMEGDACGVGGTANCPANQPPCNDPGYVLPVYEYDHSAGSCAIMGGYVYRGSAISGLAGIYVYGDNCSGLLWGWPDGSLFTPTAAGVQTFGEDQTGELYLATGGGLLYKIVANSPTPTPVFTDTSTPTATSTSTPTPSMTSTPPSPSPTQTPSSTATSTPTPSMTSTPPSPSPTQTPSLTATPSPTPSMTPTTLSPTSTPTRTPTSTATSTPLPPTATETPTATQSPTTTPPVVVGFAYSTLAPCRAVDTRGANGPWGGPPLTVGDPDRSFVLAGRCGVPPGAKSVAINLTVTLPSSAGNLRLYPGGGAFPPTSTINYGAGQTRANNAVVALGAAGDFKVHCGQSSGSVHVIVDVSGYFE
jgi:glucose/arabinose dehydrogenase